MNLLLAALLAAQPAAESGLPDGAFGWISELSGHCWMAAYPDGTRDTQCYSTQYGHFLRGTIEIETPGRAPYRGDSVFTWNADQAEMRVHYWSSSGTDGETIGRVEGDTILFTDSAPGANTRTTWTRTGPNGFRVVQQRRDGVGWSDSFALDYSRTAAGPARH